MNMSDLGSPQEGCSSMSLKISGFSRVDPPAVRLVFIGKEHSDRPMQVSLKTSKILSLLRNLEQSKFKNYLRSMQDSLALLS